jgi:hypothetical protein
MTEKMNVGKLPIPVPTPVEECHAEPEPEPNEIAEYETPDYDIGYSNENQGSEIGEQIECVVASSPHEAIERRQLLRKIFRYRTMFKTETADLPITQAPDLNITQLRSLADDVEFMVACRKSATQARTVFLTGTSIAENLAQPMGFKVKGLTQVLKQEEEVMSMVDEISIKYESDLMVSPEIRLGMTIAGICIGLHKHNSAQSCSENLETENEVSRVEKETENNVSRAEKETSLMEGL